VPWPAIPLGVLAGLVLGALGGGGAILTIPVLIYLLHLSPHAATTASLVIVGVSSLAAVPAHLRRSTCRVGDALVLAAVGTIGTYAGSRASSAVPGEVLVVLLASLLAVVGGLMIRRAGGHGEPPPAPPGSARAVSSGSVDADPPALRSSPGHLAKVVAVAIGIGLLTGFFGVGGGFAIVPALTLVLGYRVQVAVGTSLLVVALNSATALLSRLSTGGAMNWTLIALFTAGAIAGSLAGGWIGRRTSPARLQQAFGILLFLVAAYMLLQAWLTRAG